VAVILIPSKDKEVAANSVQTPIAQEDIEEDSSPVTEEIESQEVEKTQESNKIKDFKSYLEALDKEIGYDVLKENLITGKIFNEVNKMQDRNETYSYMILYLEDKRKILKDIISKLDSLRDRIENSEIYSANQDLYMAAINMDYTVLYLMDAIKETRDHDTVSRSTANFADKYSKERDKYMDKFFGFYKFQVEKQGLEDVFDLIK
jgi:RNA processing factor Prp31